MRTQLIGTVAAGAVIAISSFLATGAYAASQKSRPQGTAAPAAYLQLAQANTNRNRNRRNRANRRRNRQAGNGGNGGNRRARGNRGNGQAGGGGGAGPRAGNQPRANPRANRQGNRRMRGRAAPATRAVRRFGRFNFNVNPPRVRGRFNFNPPAAPARQRANVGRRARAQSNRGRTYRRDRGYRGYRPAPRRYARRSAPRRYAYRSAPQGYAYGPQYRRYVDVGGRRCWDRSRGRYVRYARCYPRNRYRPNLGLVILGAVLRGLAHRRHDQY